MSNEYYSRGKLLITGEYFVLEGATAFAVPLRIGQSMAVDCLEDNLGDLTWETTVRNEFWFKAVYCISSLDAKSAIDIKSAIYIQRLLQNIKTRSNVFGNKNSSLHIKTNIEFPVEWGFGSSSSLISNLAYWSDLDPFNLLFQTSKGSGYDIACARSNGPILYQNQGQPSVKDVDFNPQFLDKIYFVYLGKKQNSLESVEKYWGNIREQKSEIHRISAISESIIRSNTLDEFENYTVDHESIISSSIGIPTIKTQLFSDFDGTVKSLGAWGGDFVMVTHKGSSDYVYSYFRAKGLSTIFPYKKLVL